PIELIIGIVGSIVFIAMLLYRLNHGRKAIRLGGKAREGRLAAAVMEGGNGK
ncbi:MAG: iron ABC transporter permease, partial [Lachnospiraceae bacterium]|nr:iron ABC transporter permease [Lachnospiraceae bacterium]